MALPESFSQNDAATKTRLESTETSSASLEAWATIKNFVTNKIVDKTAPTVIIGDARYAPVNLSLAPGNVVEGTIGPERTTMHQTGSKQFEGQSPWGLSKLEFKGGNLEGESPWGKIALKVDDHHVSGDVPWGKVNLTLKGQELSGVTPWGEAHLRLGSNYRSLTNPDVLAALSAVMSER